jgi:receptor protein-tyrosine kinase
MIPAGPIPPNPAELLGSERFAKLLEQARREFDYILIDAPPTQEVSDAAILAAQVDGVLLVFDSRKASKDSLRQSVRGLQAVGANVLGTVMNNVAVSRRDTHRGFYEYGYGYEH